MTLYELTKDYEALLRSGLDAEDRECFIDTLEALSGEIEEKADSYAVVMTEMESRKKVIDAEIERLTKYSKAIEGNLKRMRARILETMREMDVSEIATPLHRFKRMKNGGQRAVVVTGEIPSGYQRIVFETDTERIRKELEDGMELPFARLRERGEHVRIM